MGHSRPDGEQAQADETDRHGGPTESAKGFTQPDARIDGEPDHAGADGEGKRQMTAVDDNPIASPKAGSRIPCRPAWLKKTPITAFSRPAATTYSVPTSA